MFWHVFSAARAFTYSFNIDVVNLLPSAPSTWQNAYAESAGAADSWLRIPAYPIPPNL